MKRLPDSLLPIAESRALRLCGRADIVEIEVDEIDIAIALRAPSATEYAEYIPFSVGAARATARYNLVASCLMYPCRWTARPGPEEAQAVIGDRGAVVVFDAVEPDLDALSKALEEIPALLEELVDAVTELATASPFEVIDVSPANEARLRAADIEPPPAARKVVVLPAGAPVRWFALRKPSRVAWDDYADGSGLAALCEKAYNLANDCIIGPPDDARVALLKWAPGLAIAMASIIADLAGVRRGEPRKKARRGSSASSAPMPNTQGSA